MTTTHRRTRRPRARTRKGAGWAAFWNLCSTLTRAWQQGRTATSTRPHSRRAPTGSAARQRAGRPRGLGSRGSQSGRLLVDLERDNRWLDNPSARDQLDDAHDQADGLGAGEPGGMAAPVPVGGSDLGGGAA